MNGHAPSLLSDLVTFINGDRGKNYPSKSDFIDGGIPFINAGNLTNGEVDFTKMKYISEEHFDRIGSGKTSPDDIIYCLRGSLGKTAIVSRRGNAAIASSLVILRPSNHCCVRYLHHFLTSPLGRAEVRRFDNGSSQPNLSATSVKNYKIPLPHKNGKPDLDEQKRIAAILDKADGIRRKRQQALRLTDDFLRSVFLDMFGDPVTNPKGWDESLTLEEIADITSGITKGRKTKGLPLREVPYLAVANVQDKHLKLNTVKTINATESEIEKLSLKKEDLLLTEGGDPDKLGRGCLWSDELPECIHQNHIFRVRTLSPKIDPMFLNWLIGSQRGKSYFLKAAKQTTGIASINKAQLRAFPMLVPPLEVQREFAKLVRAVTSKFEVSFSAKSASEDLFSSLQQRAFRGEL